MSKLNFNIDNECKGQMDNRIDELNKYVVLVEKEYIDQLENAKIPFKQFTCKDYYIVRRGKKKKKFNEEQIKQIKLDLFENGLSIRKAADKYKTSTRIIQDIKQDKY